MTRDEIINMGAFCESLSVSEQFNTLYGLFEKQVVGAMLTTKPSEGAARENLYASLQGVRDLLGFMQEFVVERRKLLTPVLVDETDNPSVHNIYAE